MGQANPTQLQSDIISLLACALSLVLFPISLSISIAAYAIAFVRGTLLSHRPLAHHNETVLITGARASKALVLTRAFRRAGHRVVLADERGPYSSLFCPARWSASADAFVLLPDPAVDPDGYAHALEEAVEGERVTAFVPASTGGASIDDARVGDRLRTLLRHVEVWIPTEDVVRALHEKDTFMALCAELGEDVGVDVPASKVVTSVDAALAFLAGCKEGGEYLLKSADFGADDAIRAGQTLLPLRTTAATRAYLVRAGLHANSGRRYVLQRFIRGREICVHTLVAHGELRAFVCCPSSDLVLRYQTVEQVDERLGVLAERWVQAFLERFRHVRGDEAASKLSGHLSFDFIYDEVEDKMYAIECNPRAHSAVTLLASRGRELADCYFNPSYPTGAVLKPRRTEPAHIWLAHSLPYALARSFLSARHHPTLSAQHDENAWTELAWSPLPHESLLSVLTSRDAQWDEDDPIPWFVLAHLHAPYLLLRSVFTRHGWARFNVSTSRFFFLS
ncbi:hypothetical protein EXIGLDRAFT_835083 [Exidia glandulosa HHB12029]|uniref:ATP-grasp domain-containing protein n=1 Tax=Exidia glandulosa HHB12029 TaxID=1314781 RepID=A0A165J453_EXIGL|nr:hypothetical protein EXIGLDRAFT_835083 [Exidia glandulosa HHB12029]